jgi:hypothetical protein
MKWPARDRLKTASPASPGTRHEYTKNWQRYRKLRNLFFAIWIGYIPAVGVFTMLVSKAFGTVTPGFVFAGMWMVMFAVTGVRLSTWKCPRCGKWFAATWWYNKGFFARKCVHCGLPKFADSDTGSGA